MTAHHLHTVNKNPQGPVIKGFLQSVTSFPKNKALWVNNYHYSYAQLAQIVYTIYQKIPSGKIYERIGIYCNDDVYTYAAILAIQLYGAAYVPLNSKFPVARNQKIIEQCKLELILSSADNEDIKSLSKKTTIISVNYPLPDNNEPVTTPPGNFSEYQKTEQPTAYILFTSGSTGEPKGVPVSHLNLYHFFDFFLKNYDFNSSDKFLQVYELTFDVSVFSFFMPLITGGCCYVVPGDSIKFITILKLLKEHQITVLSMVPGILRYAESYLNEMKFDHLRYSFFSGDALNHDLAAKWKKTMMNGEIHNFYGPTETTIVCTHYQWNESQSATESVNGIVPLGKPFDGMDILIIDENDQPAKKGELCFSGTQVIADYLNADNENFFEHRGKRYYKTGDIASCNANGNLLFYGRTDSQVKINGYRAELREIEVVIEKTTNSTCIVLCIKNEKQLNSLVAFIETTDLNDQQLIIELSSLLPDYMIPQQFIAIENFPLNSNNKTDKQLLLKHIR